MENGEIIKLETTFPEENAQKEIHTLSSTKPMGFTWAQLANAVIGPNGILLNPKGSEYPSPFEYPSHVKQSDEDIETEKKKKKKEKEDNDECMKTLHAENVELKDKLEKMGKEYNDFKQTVENAEKAKILTDVQEKAKEFGIELEKTETFNLEKLKTISETINKIPKTKEKDFGKGEVSTSSTITEDQLLKMAGL